MRELNLIGSSILSSMPRTLAEWTNQQNNSFESWKISGQLTGAFYFSQQTLIAPGPPGQALGPPLRGVTPWNPDPPGVRSALELGSVSCTCLGSGHLVEVISQRTLNTILQGAGKLARKREWYTKWGRPVHCAKYLGSPWECPRSSMLEIRQGFTELGSVENNFPGQPIRRLSISSFCFFFYLYR